MALCNVKYCMILSTQSAVERMTPDFVVGTPNKPHYPVAEHHHHWEKDKKLIIKKSNWMICQS